MVTYGFYNSINHDRVYDATQMSEIFDGIIRDGVYQYVGNKFLVDINGLEGFQVRVGTGRAWFNHTWTKNDAPLILTLPAPPTLDNYYRADAIVIDINANVNVRENKITYVTGTEVADNPSPPYPELLDGEHKQIALAYIVRKGAETEINSANINYVVGSNPCPYVTAPVQAVDLSAHVAKWQAAWEQWFQGPNGYVQTQARAFKAEIAAAEAAIENATDDINENVAEFRVWIASQKSQFNGWMDDSKNDFGAWFENLHYILDGDVAGHLQNEIDEINSGIIPIERGGTGNDQGYIQTGFKDGESTLGEFVTSEGMNTVASGKCAHAEGGGNYSHQHQDNHFESENLLRYSNPNDDEYTDLDVTDVEGGGRDYKRLSGPLTLFITGYQHNITSFYVGKVLKNKTTGDILKTDIICIGEASRNKEEYSGHIVDPNSNVSFNNNTYKDYGFFSACYKSGSTDYWYVDGKNIVDLFEPVEFTIDLPYSNTNKTITGQAASFDIPFSSIRSCIIVENGTNKLKGGSEYNDFLQKFGYPEVTKDSDLNLQSFTINSDYSYSITYTNKNIRQNTYKIKFSTKYLHEYIDVRDALDDFYAKCIVSAGSSKTTNYYWISDDKKQAGIYSSDDTLYTYGFDIGTEYALEYYYSYTLDNTDEDVPLVWIPAGDYIDIEGSGTKALGDFSHAEGYRTIANGDRSHTEGANTTTNGYASHAEGANTTTNGYVSHAEGQSTTAGDDFNNTYGDHAEGFQTIATSSIGSIVGAAGAHAEGHTTQALAGGAHAEGYNTIASGQGSHAGGIGGIAYFTGQFVHGTFGFGGNLEIIEDQDKTYTLPSVTDIFNGGLFLMTNSTSQVKQLAIQLCRIITGGPNAMVNRSRATWIAIIRDVPNENSVGSYEYFGIYLIKYEKYASSSSTKPVITPISQTGTSSAFEFGTSTEEQLVLNAKVNGGLASFEVQIIRVM